MNPQNKTTATTGQPTFLTSLLSVALIIIATSGNARGATLLQFFEVDPVVESQPYGPGRKEVITIPLPSLTISTQDVLQLQVAFKDAQRLEILNSGLDLYVYTQFRTGPGSLKGFGITSGGAVGLQIESPVGLGAAQQVFNMVDSDIDNNSIKAITSGMRFTAVAGTIQAGSSLGNFTFSLSVPDTWRNGIPFQTTTFSYNNWLKIEIIDPVNNRPLIQVVPEPAGGCMLAIAGVGLHLRARKRSSHTSR